MTTTAGHRSPVGAIEVGGSHVAAAHVHHPSDRPLRAWRRLSLRSDGTADEILECIATAATSFQGPVPTRWGVAIPGPFDYRNGIGLFQSVGKFDSLRGCNLRFGLAERLGVRGEDVLFRNDAEAFLLGEWRSAGSPADERWVAITLGSGVGSSFLDGGQIVTSGAGIFPGGHAHRLRYQGRPLEAHLSHRAIVAAHSELAGRQTDSVKEVVEAYRRHEDPARAVLRTAFSALAAAARPYLEVFKPDVVLLGGAMASSWDVVNPLIQSAFRLTDGAAPRLVGSRTTECSALVGAAALHLHTGAPASE